MKGKRVFVLDWDSCSPLGVGNAEIMESIRSNRSSGGAISLFRSDGLGNCGGAEVKGDLSHLYRDEPPEIIEALKYDRKFELIAANYHLMAERIGGVFKLVPPERKGVILGLGLDVSPLEDIQEHFSDFVQEPEWSYINTIKKLNGKPSRINTLLNPLDLSAIYLAEKLELGAFQKTVLTACAASTQAIVFGTRAIQADKVDLVVAGGTDSIINLMAYIAFGKLGIMSASAEHPSLYCRPLDVNRSGALIGEASGLCVLAGEDFVLKHNLAPKFEVIGYGNSLDGYKITAPDPDGHGMKAAIREALESSGVDPSEVGYINLHGTGTRSNDEVELQAVIDVFQEKAASVSVSSTKSRHGHAIAAAGIQEFNLMLGCMQENIVPFNLNLENPILRDKVDIVMGGNRDRELRVAMTNNFAFGGVNTSIVVKKV